MVYTILSKDKFDIITQILNPFIHFTIMQLFTKIKLLFILLLAGTACLRAQSVVFRSGNDNYSTFRIPAIIKAPNGDLLAFCEGRVNNSGDFGNIDIVMKRSTDGGNSWSSIQVVVDADSLQAGNPAPVVDVLDPAYPGGRIFLFYNTGNNHEGEVRKVRANERFYMLLQQITEKLGACLLIFQNKHIDTEKKKTGALTQIHPDMRCN